jgi:hypothetical protein
MLAFIFKIFVYEGHLMDENIILTILSLQGRMEGKIKIFWDNHKKIHLKYQVHKNGFCMKLITKWICMVLKLKFNLIKGWFKKNLYLELRLLDLQNLGVYPPLYPDNYEG